MVPYRGPCKDYVHKWFFNTTTGECNTFVFGGCMGNLNRFDSQLECMHFCIGGETSKLYIILCRICQWNSSTCISYFLIFYYKVKRTAALAWREVWYELFIESDSAPRIGK